MPKLILLNKPYRVLSQFTDKEGRHALADFIKIQDVYAAGRLDYDSEGLLLLTDDGHLQSLISHPKYKLKKTYWAQVEGVVTKKHCDTLIKGVELKDGYAAAVNCRPIELPSIWHREPPIRVRKTVVDSWIELTINEGRNRQVRRMTASVGLPTLRLIRAQIGSLHIGDLLPGDVKIYKGTSASSIFNNLLRSSSAKG